MMACFKRHVPQIEKDGIQPSEMLKNIDSCQELFARFSDYL